MVGFDTSLVEYTEEMTQLLIQTYLNALVEDFDYPKELLQIHENTMPIVVDSMVVWDLENGNLLALAGAEKNIYHAVSGFE